MAEETRTEVVGHYEMLWDCEHCGTTRLLGKSQRHCAECGAAQNPDKRYFPKEGEEKQVDGHAYEGADRKCGSCQTPMANKAKNCTSCGAAMDGSSTEVKSVASKPPPAAKKPFPILYVIVGIILIGGLVWWRCIRTKDATMKVTMHKWEREIAIQVFGEIQKSAWRDQMPPDAKSVSCGREKRDTKQIADGETCNDEKVDNGDGTFRKEKKCKTKYRDEPIMDDKCSFTVIDWKDVGPAKTNGVGLDPKWPTDGVPPADVARTVGAKRAGAKKETYRLEFGAQGCEVSEAVWRKYTDDQSVKLEVRASSGDIVCKSL